MTFPDDLLEAQRAWYATYRRLATADQNTPVTPLRRRLQQLSAQITAHPYWKTCRTAPAARMELKQAAWGDYGE